MRNECTRVVHNTCAWKWLELNKTKTQKKKSEYMERHTSDMKRKKTRGLTIARANESLRPLTLVAGIAG